MAEMKPTVSVIIPVFNRQAFIAEAIQSVLDQTIPPDQVIVMDDGSNDRTADITKAHLPFIEYYFQPRGGVANARNNALKYALGDFFAFLDSDDFWFERKNEIQLHYMCEHPEIDVSFSYIVQFSGNRMPEKHGCFDKESVFPGMLTSTMMIRRDSFFRVGLFDETYTIGEFADWITRAQIMGLNIKMLPDVLACRRIHKSNIGKTERSKQVDYLRVVKNMLDHNRKKTESHDR